MNPPVLLQAKGLHKSFEAGAVVPLDDVDLTVGAGMVVAVTGSSGSGKTTLLNIVGLLDQADSGEVWIAGQRVDSARGRHARSVRSRHLGFVFQDALLDPDRTAEENVATGLRRAGVPRSRRRARAREVLHETGVLDRGRARARTLSGGERQRVAVARAVAHGPAVLLCDEPTGSLDEENSDQVFSLLRRQADLGSAVVIVTHDTDLAARCDVRAHLSRGRLTWS